MKLVLKGSVVAILASGVATGCGSDNDDGDTGGEAGQPSSGGSNATAGAKGDEGGGGGTDAVGGGNDGGTTSPGGATAGGGANVAGEASGGAAQGGETSGGAAQGGANGMAVGKFCNGIVLSTDEDGEGGAPAVDNATTFRVELGEGDDVVTFTAVTGECAPAEGEACTPIPVGSVPYKLFDADTDTVLDSGEVSTIEDGEEWFFWSEIFEGAPVLAGGTEPGLVCADTTYDDLFPVE